MRRAKYFGVGLKACCAVLASRAVLGGPAAKLQDLYLNTAEVGRVPIADQDIWFTQVILTSTSPASVIILATVSRGQ